MIVIYVIGYHKSKMSYIVIYEFEYYHIPIHIKYEIHTPLHTKIYTEYRHILQLHLHISV